MLDTSEVVWETPTHSTYKWVLMRRCEGLSARRFGRLSSKYGTSSLTVLVGSHSPLLARRRNACCIHVVPVSHNAEHAIREQHVKEAVASVHHAGTVADILMIAPGCRTAQLYGLAHTNRREPR